MAHAYYNIALTNSGDVPIDAAIIEQRNHTIIAHPKSMEMSIVRFQVSGALIPIFIPEIPDEKDPTLTSRSITLTYQGNSFQEFIRVTQQEAEQGIFFYNTYLEHVNTAVAVAFIALKAAFPAATPTVSPIFVLNYKTKLVSMYVQDGYLESDPNTIEIASNHELENLLGLPNRKTGVNTIDGRDHIFYVRNFAVTTPDPGFRIGFPSNIDAIVGDVLEVSQEYSNLNAWSSVDKILFTTNLMPVKPEFIPDIASIVDGNSSVSRSSMPIITDFIIPKSADSPISRGYYQYLPTAEYRIVDFNSSGDFTSIDVQAFWQDVKGRTHKILLDKGENMSMKIMFRRRRMR